VCQQCDGPAQRSARCNATSGSGNPAIAEARLIGLDGPQFGLRSHDEVRLGPERAAGFRKGVVVASGLLGDRQELHAAMLELILFRRRLEDVGMLGIEYDPKADVLRIEISDRTLVSWTRNSPYHVDEVL
jgi:hypothetical protein